MKNPLIQKEINRLNLLVSEQELTIEQLQAELKEFRSAMIDYHLNELQKGHPHPSVADANAWIQTLLTNNQKT